jgi:hypothetical protein
VGDAGGGVRGGAGGEGVTLPATGGGIRGGLALLGMAGLVRFIARRDASEAGNGSARD